MKLKIKLQKDYIIFFIVILISFLLYIQYQFSKNNLIDKYKSEEYAKTVQIRDGFKSVLNRVELVFKTKLGENLKVLREVYNLYQKNIDVDKIADLINKNENKGHYEVFLIDKNFTIVKASYKPDLGLNLGKFEKYRKVFEDIFLQKRKIDISYLIFDYSSFTIKRYFLILAPDKKHLIQLAYAVDVYPLLKDTYYKFLNQFRDLKELNLYFMDKYLVYPVDFRHRYQPKKQIDEIVKETKIFFINFLKQFSNKIPTSFEALGKEVLKLFYKNHNVLKKFELKNHSYIIYTLSEGFFKNFSNRLIIKNEFSTALLERDLEALKTRFFIVLLFFLFSAVIVKFLILYISKKIKDLVSHMKKNRAIEKPNSIIKELDDLVVTYNDYRERLNKEIEKNKKLLEDNKRFVIDTLHQLKTPLSIIALNSDFLKMQLNNKELREILEEIEAAIAMLNNSYEDLAYFSSQDTVDYKPINLNISEVIKSRINFFIPLAKARGKKLIFEIDENIFFNINKVEMERLIDNNISNAIAYSKGEEIKVVLKKEKNRFIFRVESIGDKIKNPNKIFEKNYREHSHKRGLGIGLNIVKKICEKYGIEYKVVSKNGKNIFEYIFLLQLQEKEEK